MLSSEWLNDGIIHAAQSLLRQQTKAKVFGWQSSQCSKRKGLFCPLPPNSPFIQILHVQGCHWITTSNVDPCDGDFNCRRQAVDIYDSGRAPTISLSTKKMICSFMKPNTNTLHFDLMNIQDQQNSYDCGVYAIAYATELAHGKDPILCR